MCIRMPKLKNWKKKRLTTNSHDIKETIDIWVTLHWEIKLQKNIYSKVWPLSQLLICLFSALDWMWMCIRMPRLKNQERRYVRKIVKRKIKKLAYKWPLSYKLSYKPTFLYKYDIFKKFMSPFWTKNGLDHIRMVKCTGMSRLKNWKRRTWK